MRQRAFLFFLCLAAVCAAVLWPSPSFAATAKDRYIKVVGVEGGVLTLDVDGKPVKIPLPEGYEVMQEKEFAETYTHIVEKEKRLDSVLLTILVDSKDAQERRSGQNNKYKFITFCILDIHIDERYTINTYQQEKDEIEFMANDANEWANSELQKKGRSPFTMKLLLEDKKSLCFLETEDYAGRNGYQLGLTRSYILFEDIVVTVLLQKNMKKLAEIDSIVKDATSYINLVRRWPKTSAD